jgi:hypothetical protein
MINTIGLHCNQNYFETNGYLQPKDIEKAKILNKKFPKINTNCKDLPFAVAGNLDTYFCTVDQFCKQNKIVFKNTKADGVPLLITTCTLQFVYADSTSKKFTLKNGIITNEAKQELRLAKEKVKIILINDIFVTHEASRMKPLKWALDARYDIAE